LKENNRVKVLWHGWCGPTWSKFMSFFVAGESGLIKVNDITFTSDLFIEVASYSASDLLYIPSQLTDQVLLEVKEHRNGSKLDIIVNQNSDSLYISAELDEPVVKNNENFYFCEVVCSNELKSFLIA